MSYMKLKRGDAYKVLSTELGSTVCGSQGAGAATGGRGGGVWVVPATLLWARHGKRQPKQRARFLCRPSGSFEKLKADSVSGTKDLRGRVRIRWGSLHIETDAMTGHLQWVEWEGPSPSFSLAMCSGVQDSGHSSPSRTWPAPHRLRGARSSPSRTCSPSRSRVSRAQGVFCCLPFNLTGTAT